MGIPQAIGNFAGKARLVLTDPQMLAAYARWVRDQSLRRNAQIPLLGHGRLGSFRTFSDYWTTRINLPSAPEVALLGRPTGPRPTLLDIGANLGVFTVLMARLQPTAEVLAFEPSPGTYRSLVENTRLNRLSNATCFNLAVADRVGTVQFRDDPRRSATNKIVTGVESVPHTRTVAATKLDDFCAERGLEAIELAKIDVEGAEPLVLRGAERLLRERRIHRILIEWCPRNLRSCGFEGRDLWQTASDLGYVFRSLASDGSDGPELQLDNLNRVDLANVLLVPSS